MTKLDKTLELFRIVIKEKMEEEGLNPKDYNIHGMAEVVLSEAFDGCGEMVEEYKDDWKNEE